MLDKSSRLTHFFLFPPGGGECKCGPEDAEFLSSTHQDGLTHFLKGKLDLHSSPQVSVETSGRKKKAAPPEQIQQVVEGGGVGGAAAASARLTSGDERRLRGANP